MVPLVFNPAGYFIFLPAKWLFAVLLVGAGVAAVLVTSGRLPSGRASKSWIALLAAMAVATALSVSPPTSLFGSGGRNLGLVAWLLFAGAFVIGASLTADRLDRVLVAAAWASLPVSVYALVQAAGIDPIEWREGLDLSRSRSTLGNAAFLGAYLALVLPVFGRLGLDTLRTRSERRLYGAAAALAFVALLTTQTRGAWLGALAGTVLVVVLERRRLQARVVLTGLALLLVLGAVAALTPVGARVASIGDIGGGTAQGRLLQWDLTVELVTDRPLFGWGPDTFVVVFPRYITAEYERKVGREVLPDRAHNVLLDVAAAGGVVAAGALLWLLASLGLAVIAIGRRPAPAAVGLAGGVVAYVVQGLFGFPLADVDVLFWLLAGAMSATVAKAQPAPAERGRLATVAPAVSIVVLAVIALVPATRELVADSHLRAGLEAEARGDIEEADGRFERASSSGLAQYEQADARFGVRMAESTESEARVSDALVELGGLIRRPGPNPEFDLDRADALLARGEITGDSAQLHEAELAYREVLRRDPNSSRALLKLGVAVVEQGRTADATRIWRRAAALAPRATGPLLNLGTLYEREGETASAVTYYRRVLAFEPDNKAARSGLERLTP